MRRRLWSYFLTLVGLIGLVSTAVAQSADIHASLWYDDSTGTMIGFCETNIDSGTYEYYQAAVQCLMVDQNGNYVAQGSASDPWSFTVDVTVEAPAAAECSTPSMDIIR